MGRTTKCERPPIAELILPAPDIESLAEILRQIDVRRAEGKLDADPATVERWDENTWKRVIQLILRAPTGRAALYVFNFTYVWPKPADFHRALEELALARAANAPSDVELAAHCGIVIEGISTRRQVQIALNVRAGIAEGSK